MPATGKPTHMGDTPVAQIKIPWPLAKALAGLMKSVVEQYEKVEGEIALPRTFLEGK